MTKVLVTGGSGFIGNTIVKLLVEKGFEVNVLDLWDVGVERINYFKGSVLNMYDIEKAISGCDYVVHLAAILGVSKATHQPVECLDVNVRGMRNILESSIKNKIKKILFSSSSEVYGEPDKVPIKEDDPLQPKSEYGVSKVVGEEYLKAYKKQYGLNYTIIRFFNVYGIQQRHAWVIPKFTNYAILGKPLMIYGDGNQVRAFCHVDDAARGVVEALLSEKTNNMVFNIGNSKEEISMKELALKILKIVGRDDGPQAIPMKDSDRTKEREIYKRVPATQKAKDVFGFEAKINLDEGIKELIEHKKNYISEVEKEVKASEEFEKKLLENNSE